MSVRARPASNRFLDMKEKEIKYRQHMNFVKTAKGGIDMTTPDLPPRLRLAQRNNAIYRGKLIKNMAVHDRLIETNRRPLTALDDIPLFPTKKHTTKIGAVNDHEIYKVESAQSRRPKRVDIESETVIPPISPSNRHSSSYSGSYSSYDSKEPENIRIDTIDKNDTEKVRIITDKPNESQEMVVLTSEKHSENESSDISDSEEKISSEKHAEKHEDTNEHKKDKSSSSSDSSYADEEKTENKTQNETESPKPVEKKEKTDNNVPAQQDLPKLSEEIKSKIENIESSDTQETRQKTEQDSSNFITGQTESMVNVKFSFMDIIQGKTSNF